MADYSGSGNSDWPRGHVRFVRQTRLSPSLTGRLCLTKDMNCASATLEALQDLAGRHDDLLLRAVTGLEGGVMASGSTCGVLTAGVIGIAQMCRENLTPAGPQADEALLALAARYVRWFGDTIGTIVCREHTGVDFYTAAGQIRYFIPGDRVLRCTAHIGTAVDHLWRIVEGGPNVREPVGQQSGRPVLHCAGAVLSSIRERTGVGHVGIEDLSIVLDGGVGLAGGACGAPRRGHGSQSRFRDGCEGKRVRRQCPCLHDRAPKPPL